jgi:hypothetical protein
MEGLNFRQANPPLSVSDCVRLTNRLNRATARTHVEMVQSPETETAPG